MSEKAPSFQYYPKDWRADSVFTCSLAARGLWREMMDMMHANVPYGQLSAKGKPIPDEQIARYCGCTTEEFKKYFAELFAAGVPRMKKNKIIYSKRMQKDWKKRLAWRKRQQKSRDKSRDNRRDVTRVSRPSSSPSSSASASPSPSAIPTSNTLMQKLGVSLSLFDEFCRMRERVHRPVLAGTEDYIFIRLMEFQAQGENPSAVLEQAIRTSSWELYPVRDIKQERKSKHEQVRDATESAAEELRREIKHAHR